MPAAAIHSNLLYLSKRGEREVKTMPDAILCMDYRVKKGRVFVWTSNGWSRTDAAKARPERIIRCSKCHEPAVVLDHMYPHDSAHNRCGKHAEVEP